MYNKSYGFLLSALTFALTGCAGNLPLSAMQLVADGNAVRVNDLHCAENGVFVASGRAGNQGAILYSEDRGGTWRKASINPPATGIPLTLVKVPSPSNKSALFAAGHSELSRNISIPIFNEPAEWWVSLDDGRTWNQTAVPLPLGDKQFGMFGSSLPVIVDADHKGTWVALSNESGGVFLLRSIDDGEHWTKRHLNKPRDFAANIVSDGRGHLTFIGKSLATHPFSFDEEDMVYWSSDAGATWNEGVPPDSLSFIPLRLYLSPNGTIIAFNSDMRKYGGTFIIYSGDNGKSWKQALRMVEFGKIIGVDGDARGRIVAFTDMSMILLSDDGGASWRNIGRQAAVSARDDIFSLVKFTGDNFVFIKTGNKILRSADRGDTWTVVDSKLPAGDYRFRAICVDGKGLVLATGDGMLTRSLDWGATWQPGKMD